MLKLPYKDGEVTPLGFVAFDDRVYFFYSSHHTDGSVFRIDVSEDGKKFSRYSNEVEIKYNGDLIHPEGCKDFKITRYNDDYYLLFRRKVGSEYVSFIAVSKDLIKWHTLGKNLVTKKGGLLVPGFAFKGGFVFYFGLHALYRAYSGNLKSWEKFVAPVLKPKLDYYGKPTIILGNSIPRLDRVILFYFLRKGTRGKYYYTLKVVSFNKNNPAKVVSSKREIIWRSGDEWVRRMAEPIDVIIFKDWVVSYWHSRTHGIFAVYHSTLEKIFEQKREIKRPINLRKLHHNPIIKPISGNGWESKATFNPAAIYEGGKVHLLYRAVGDQDVSVIGYAASYNGIHFHERHNHPIYTTGVQQNRLNHPKQQYKPVSYYTSGGGGYGGVEDPRLTNLEGKIYMTYAAFNGYEQARSAFTSISKKDFLESNWNWSAPVLMTAKPTVWGTGGKNACILSEKINGKYAIMHRFWPNILIDYVDDLNFGEDSKYLRGGKLIKLPENIWKSGRFSIGGAVPLEVDSGWLVFYGTYSLSRSPRYTIGVRLLDKFDTGRMLADYPDIESDKVKEFLESKGIITPKAHMWDSGKIAVGPPPVKTNEGWLLIYQAVGYHDSSKYKVGAMLLDSDNPAKVLHRSIKPILEPSEWYENHGHKAGVVYPCGAVVMDGDLYVYYGGADTVVCVAQANMDEFLYHLKNQERAELYPVEGEKLIG